MIPVVELAPELITDDPRREVEDSPISEARRFIAFMKQGGGLMASQLAKCADVKPQAIQTKLVRGRLKYETFFGVKWIPREECQAYLVSKIIRQEEAHTQGRGIKSPSIAEMFKATNEEIKQLGI